MKELKGNMLEIDGDALVFTTNGFVTSRGKAVMGRGIAAAISNALPGIEMSLGALLKRSGNCCYYVTDHNGMALVSFPVKPFSVINDGKNVVSHAAYKYPLGATVPGFHAVAQMSIIERSAKELVNIADANGWKEIICPRFGCGAGELKWEDVKPVVEQILDDRFTCVTW